MKQKRGITQILLALAVAATLLMWVSPGFAALESIDYVNYDFVRDWTQRSTNVNYKTYPTPTIRSCVNDGNQYITIHTHFDGSLRTIEIPTYPEPASFISHTSRGGAPIVYTHPEKRLVVIQGGNGTVVFKRYEGSAAYSYAIEGMANWEWTVYPQGIMPGMDGEHTLMAMIATRVKDSLYGLVIKVVAPTQGYAFVPLDNSYSAKSVTVATTPSTQHVYLFKRNETDLSKRQLVQVQVDGVGTGTISATSTVSPQLLPISDPVYVTGYGTEALYVVTNNYSNGSKLSLCRINIPSMTLDTGFGTDGYLALEATPVNIVIKNNKITLFMQEDGITRLNMDGTKDATFGVAGHLPDYLWAGDVLDDNRIYGIKHPFREQFVVYNNGLSGDVQGTITCDEFIYQGREAQCSLSYSTPGTTEPMTVTWSIEGGAVVEASNGSTVAIRANTSGPFVVKARIIPTRFPDAGLHWDFASAPITTTPRDPVVAVIDMICPAKVYTGTSYSCNIVAEGNIVGYDWHDMKFSSIVSGQGTDRVNLTAGEVSGPEVIAVDILTPTTFAAETFYMGFTQYSTDTLKTLGITGGALQNWIIMSKVEPNVTVARHQVYLLHSKDKVNGVAKNTGWLKEIMYAYHSSPDYIGSYKFVLVDDTNRITWSSGLITATAEELGKAHTYVLDKPAAVKPGYSIGIAVPHGELIPFTSNGNAPGGGTNAAGGQIYAIPDGGSNIKTGNLAGTKLVSSYHTYSTSTPLLIGVISTGYGGLDGPDRTLAQKAVQVTAPAKPKIAIDGPKTVVEKATTRYTAITDADASGENMVLTWDVNGETMSGNYIDFHMDTPGRYVIKASAYREEYPDLIGETAITVSVRAVPPPRMTITCSNKCRAEVGYPMILEAKVTKLQEGLTPVVTWQLPDLTTPTGTSITYTPRPSDEGDIMITAQVHPQGYESALSTAKTKVKVSRYVMPVFTIKKNHKPTGTAPYGVTYKINADLKAAKGEVFTYAWDMGDGTVYTTEDKRITHTYPAGGTYDVSLTVSDTRGHTQTITDTVTVADQPEIVVGSIKVSTSNKYMKAPLTVRLRPKVTGGNQKKDKIQTYQWYVNGAPMGDNKAMGVFTFNEPGTYDISLTATSQYGYEGSGSTTITVVQNQPPNCTIAHKYNQKRGVMQYDAVCKDPDGKIKGYEWDFGGGLTASTRKASVKYDTGGTYSATLTAYDDNGDSTTVSKEVTVEGY